MLDIPSPESRRERYLNYLATGEGEYPEPVSRIERYLYYLCENRSTGVEFRKVEELPETGEEGVIYLVPKEEAKTDDVYDEYIWQDEAWEKIGTTEIPLDNYYTKTETDAAIQAAIGDTMEGAY